jgi:threonine synthase
MQIVCPACGTRETSRPDLWRCRCGGTWEPIERGDFSPAQIDPAEQSVWRYRRFLGLGFRRPSVRLGAGWTPLLPLEYRGRRVLFKLEYLSPTSSFKDRGTTVVVNVLSHQRVDHVVDDSSGNAGASLAAYAARAGMRAEIYVPAYASEAKRAQIGIYGAGVHPIPGPRVNAKLAAWQAAERGAVYASHTYHPAFLTGQQTAAWELWEQLGRGVPTWIVVPVGQGLNLLGYWLGFRRLLAAGLVDRLPRMVAVQPTRLAPVCHALDVGLDTVAAVEPREPSIAEGLAISQPARGRRLLQAIRETGGTGITVEERSIQEAQQRLAHQGLYIEPTSAAAVAALETLFQHAGPQDTIVTPLTGSGLKGSPHLAPDAGAGNS